jgi:hypothetical protein
MIGRSRVLGPSGLLVAVAVPAAAALVLALSSPGHAILSITLALAALGAALGALGPLAQRSAPSADLQRRSPPRSGPIFAVDLERELWRIRPIDRVGVVGTLDLVANVLEVMPPVDQLWVLTSLPRLPHRDELRPGDFLRLRRAAEFLQHENAQVHVEPNPVGGGIVQYSERDMLVSLPEFSRSKSGLPAVWLALRGEDNRALVEDFMVDLGRRWGEAKPLDPADLEALDWGETRW